jgi:hypothetical protein
MPPAPGSDPAAALGPMSIAWLESQRRTTALQLEALSPRGARHRTARAAYLRRRLRALDSLLAARRAPRSA